jgi:P4 family phage/plasmid primase-like protien
VNRQAAGDGDGQAPGLGGHVPPGSPPGPEANGAAPADPGRNGEPDQLVAASPDQLDATATDAGDGQAALLAAMTPLTDPFLDEAGIVLMPPGSGIDLHNAWLVAHWAFENQFLVTLIERGNKRPMYRAWGLNRPTRHSIDHFFYRHADGGCGVCLGPGQGPLGTWIIDTEGDGPEAEESFRKLFGGDIAATFGWRSPRGIHLIFVVRDGTALLELLKAAGAAVVKGEGKGPGVFKLDDYPALEWRIGGYKSDGIVKQFHSVIPPLNGRVFNDCWTIAWFPAAATAALSAIAERREAECEPGASGDGGDPTSNGRPRRRTPTFEEDVAAFGGKPPGERHAFLLTMTMRAARAVERGDLTESEVLKGLRAAAKENGMTAEGDWAEVEAAWASARTQVKSTRRRRPRSNDPELDKALSACQRTDIGNGERLIARHGCDLRYCHPWRRWLVWDGRRWAKDDTGGSAARAKNTARMMLCEIANVFDKGERKAYFKWHLYSESTKAVNAMLASASSEPGIPILPGRMDQDGWLLNVQNGTIDLETGALRPHRREELITCLALVEYDPDAKCPVWDSVLEKIFNRNANMIAFVQRLFGMALTADISEQVLPIFWGSGANGKTTLLTAILEMMGSDYAVMAPPGLLLVKRGEAHPTERACLFGKRLVVDMESAEDARLDETTVKRLTGSDPITARRMREDFWTFSPTHKIILGTNHKPVIRETKHAIWRRVKLVPFTITIPDNEVDKTISARLRGEYSGILAWCVRGCLDWQRDGLNPPPEVTTATDKYKDEEDVLGQFLAAECLLDPQLVAGASDLYSRYREYKGDHALSQHLFGRALTERGFERFENHGIHYRGIMLRPIVDEKQAKNASDPPNKCGA